MRMTISEAHAAIGKWVERLPSGQYAIVCRVARGSVLVREATDRGHYAWTGPEGLIRRQDCDRNPDPKWLADARVSPRQPKDLYYVLNPDRIPSAAEAADHEASL
jgi:hypothetical protein